MFKVSCTGATGIKADLIKMKLFQRRTEKGIMADSTEQMKRSGDM